LTPAPAPART